MEVVLILFLVTSFVKNVFLYKMYSDIKTMEEDIKTLRRTQSYMIEIVEKMFDRASKIDEKISGIKEKKLTTNNWENIKEAFNQKKPTSIID